MKDATTSKMRVTSKRKMQVMSTHSHVRSSNGRTLPACSRTTICRMSVIVLLLTSLSLVPVSNATTYIGQTEGDVIGDDTTIPFSSSAYPTPSFTPAVGVVANSGETKLLYSANLPNLSQTSAETASNTETVLSPSEPSVSFTISSPTFMLPMLDTPTSSLTSVVAIVQSFFAISETSLQSASSSTMTPPQIKPADKNNILSSTLLEVASIQLTSEPISIDSQDTITLQTETQQLPVITSHITTEPPQLATETPQLSIETQLATETPQLKTKTQQLLTETPKLPTETPQLPTETPQLATETPQLPTETPQLATETPQLSTETPQLATETQLPTETPQLPTKTQQLLTETPKLPTETPQLPTETQQLLTETPQLPTETPQIPTETPQLSQQLSPSRTVKSPSTPSSPQSLTAINPSEMLTSPPSPEPLLTLNLVASASSFVTSVLELSPTNPVQPPSKFLDVSAVVSPDLISPTTTQPNPTYNSVSWTANLAFESSATAHISTEDTALSNNSYTLELLETDSQITVDDLSTSLTDSSDTIDLPNSLAIDLFSTPELDPYFMDSSYTSTTELYLLSTTEITPQNTLNIDYIDTSEIDPQCATDIDTLIYYIDTPEIDPQCATDTPNSFETVSESTTETPSSNVNTEMFSSQTTAEFYTEKGGITSVLRTTELSVPSFTQVPNTTLSMTSTDPKTLPQITTPAQTFTTLATSATTKLNPTTAASTTITTASTTTAPIPTTTVTSIQTNTTPTKIATTATTTSSKTNETSTMRTQTTTTQRTTTSNTTIRTTATPNTTISIPTSTTRTTAIPLPISTLTTLAPTNRTATTSTARTPTPPTRTSTKSDDETTTTRPTTPTTKSATTTTPKTATSIPTYLIPTTASSITPTIKSNTTTTTPTTPLATTPTPLNSTPTTTTPKSTILAPTTATSTTTTPTSPSTTITSTPSTKALITATTVPTTTSLKTTTSTPKATSSITTTTIPTSTTSTKATTTSTKTTLTTTTETKTTAKSTTTTTALTTSIKSNPTTTTSAPSTLVYTNQPSTTLLSTQANSTPAPSSISTLTLTSPQPETPRSAEPTNSSPPVAYTAALFCQPLGTANQTTVIAEMYWDVMLISTEITLYLDGTEMIQCNITANGCTFTKSNTYSVKGSSFEIFNWNLGYAVSFDVGFPRVETLNFSVMITAGGQVQNASCSSVHQSEPVDECVTQPDVCGHGGQCLDEELGFTCNCRPGYQGHTCSQSNNGVYCEVDQLTIHVPYHGLGDVCFTSSTPINCTIAGPAWNSSGDYSATLVYWKYLDTATDLTVAVNGSHLDHQLCLTPDSLPGINEAVYNITNPKASFDFTFTLTLDIQFNNTPPRFNRDTYTVAISSYRGGVLVYVNKSSTDTCLNSPCIEVIDPDKNAKLGVSSLMFVVRSNSGSSKIFFSNNDSSDSFGYFSFLNAPSENETFQLTAVDGQNASAQAEVNFEVNYPPVCPAALSIDHLDVLANGIIATLNCTEPEVGVYLSDTNYNVSSNMEAYFAVSSTGSIYVINPLTSLAIGLYNFTITTVGKITDASGSTITTFSVQVPVSFNLTAPTPNCLLTDLTIPLMWKPSDIFKINLVCQNYSIDSLAIKSVTFSDGTVFNASKLEKSGNDSYSIDINLLQYKAGTYNCWVTATYGSEPSTTNTTIVVPESPFQQIHDPTILVYTNASVGEMVWNISKELNFSLSIYSIEVKEFPMIDLLFVNTTTGIITLDFYPNYYINGNYTLVLRIIEINTSLYIDVNVTVRIVDVNGPPSCILTYNNISVNDVNTEIGYLNCTDPDTTDEYRNLDYFIAADPSLPVNISSTGRIHLVGPIPPGISTAFVLAAVSATDGTFKLNFPFQLYIFGCELTYITQRPLYWTRSTNVLLNLHCGTYNNGILKIYSNTTSPKQVFRVSEVYSNSTDVQLNLTQMEYRPDDYTLSVYVIINGVTVSTSLLIRVSNETTIMGGNRTILQNHNVTTPVFYISVTVDNSNPVLIFTITGDQHNLFKINQDEKSVYLNRTLSNDDVGIHEFNISVTDHSTSLTVWATFVVSVEDVNEAPTCTPPKVLVPILSDENLFTPIAEINCTDPDRTEPFKSLNYMISTVPSSILDITEYTGIVFLAVELKYTNLSDTTIYATVNVTSIDLSVSLTFSLTISAACQAESRDGVQFNKTFVGKDFVANCPANYTGSVERSCKQGAVWGPFVLSNCTRASLSEAITAAGELANTSLSAEEITHKVELIVASLNTSLATNSTLISGDIKNMLGIFNTIGGALNRPGAVVRIATLEMFVDISSAMVETKGQVWSELRNDTVDQTAVLLYSLERITATSLRTLNQSITLINRSSVAIALYTGAEEINFPQIFLPKDALKDKVNYSVIVYKQLADKIQINNENQKNYSQGLELLSKTMNSDIMSISIPNTTISKPVELTLALNQDNLTSPSCAFLNTTISNPEVGVWSTGGCQVKSFTSTHVVCSCDHLTNFAVLMSPYASSEDSLALSIISAIGCAISLFCLVITIIVYIVVWKYVKNDRSVLHVNLCVCLIAGYIIFLAGVDRTDDPAGCTVVAALLHFFFLAVFFIMLGEGIEIMKSVIVVFTSRSILVYLLAVAYGVPLVIVAISLGVTKTEGYGNEMSCWLSVDSGLIWAFIGPVLFVFVANLIILIVVIRAIQTSQIMRDKSTKEKVKSVARSICVLSPILGITWIFGVLSVSKETVVFQYLFAIFNSLQGLFIFIFQCFLQHQVRDGVKALRRKYYAVSLDSSHKKSSSNTNRYSESNSNTASRSKNVSSGSTQSTYEVGSPVTDHKPNFNQIKNPAFHETLETKRSNKSARSSSEKSEKSASSNDSRRPFDKFDESHEDHFIYLRGGSYYGDINPNFVQIPGYSIENNKVNHEQIDSDQNQDKFGSTKKETWHLVSRKRKSGQEENPEIEKERLKQIYGKVNAINGLQNNENLTANQIKARERWKKVQNFTKSPERAFTKAELFGARMANTEDFTLSPNGSVSSSSKKSSKTSKRPNLTPLIIPRPMTFPLPEPDYHSSI